MASAVRCLIACQHALTASVTRLGPFFGKFASERPLAGLRHALVEDGDERFGGQRAQALQGLADLGPVGIWLPGGGEGLPDALPEQAHERSADRVGVVADV